MDPIVRYATIQDQIKFSLTLGLVISLVFLVNRLFTPKKYKKLTFLQELGLCLIGFSLGTFLVSSFFWAKGDLIIEKIPVTIYISGTAQFGTDTFHNQPLDVYLYDLPSGRIEAKKFLERLNDLREYPRLEHTYFVKKTSVDGDEEEEAQTYLIDKAEIIRYQGMENYKKALDKYKYAYQDLITKDPKDTKVVNLNPFKKE